LAKLPAKLIWTPGFDDLDAASEVITLGDPTAGDTTFSLAGVATVSFISEAIADAEFTIAGVATTSFIAETADSTFAIAGVATFTALSSVLETTGTSDGSATVNGIGQAGRWPESTTLRPEVVDDGWGGALSYLWTQESGPVAATITTPTAQWTEVLFTETLGTYVFKLTVTRADDGLIGTGLWRVVVYPETAVAVVLPPEELEYAVVSFNHTPQIPENAIQLSVLINQLTISEEGLISTCSFTMSGVQIDVFDEVIITREGVRLFAGICMTRQVYEFEGENALSRIELVGFGWRLYRKRFTKAYAKQSITAILTDVLHLAQNPPGGGGTGIDPTYVTPNLPPTEVVFTNVTAGDAIEQLATTIGAHYRVDHFGNLHFAVLETGNDPDPLTVYHPTMRNLSVTRDGSQTANRVTLHYDRVEIRPVVGGVEEVPLEDDAEPLISPDGTIEVSSLEGFNRTGGIVEINGNKIRYSNAIRRRQTNFGDTLLNIDVQPYVDASGQLDGAANPLYNYWTDRGSFGGPEHHLGPNIYYYSYATTLVTPYGETRPVWSEWSYVFMEAPNNSMRLQLKAITFPYHDSYRRENYGTNDLGQVQIDTSEVSAINLYTILTETSNDDLVTGSLANGFGYFIGTIDPKGGHFIDTIDPANYEQFPIFLNSDVEAGEKMAFFLTGCSLVTDTSGGEDEVDTTEPAVVSVTTRQTITVNDLAAQAALGPRIGIGDDGVLEIVLEGGVLTDAKALEVANKFLADAVNVSTILQVDIRDDNAHPGQMLSMNLPAPFNQADLKIQTMDIKGFEGNVPHEQSVTAAVTRIKLEDLLRDV